MGDTENYTHVATLAGLPRTQRGKFINISCSPKGDKLLYCNGNSIFIRDLENPMDCDIYSQHAKETSAAKYSPSGFYIASGDITGKVRIWDTVNKEHILKVEHAIIGGVIKDIAWSEDSKRLAICGEGRENFARAVNWDTGTNCGDLSGFAKSCNAVDIKQNRPFRCVVVSEDYGTRFFEGYPFKQAKENGTIQDHENFVNCARFSPDGNYFATSGADKTCLIYDGKTGEKKGDMCSTAGKIHDAGVYAISWSSDSSHLMTASADKKVKVWDMTLPNFLDVKEKKCWTLGKDINDMQVGGVWSSKGPLISVSLSGDINIFNDKDVESVSKVIKGHNKPIVNSCTHTAEDGTLTVFSSSLQGSSDGRSSDGRVCFWNLTNGEAGCVSGKPHSNQVQGMATKGNKLATVGMDDTLRFADITYDGESKAVTAVQYDETSVKLPSQPQGVAFTKAGLVVVACHGDILVCDSSGKVLSTKKTDASHMAVGAHPNEDKVAVGTDQMKVMIYGVGSDGTLTEEGSFPTNGDSTDIAFSPDGQMLAASTGKKQVKIVRTTDYQTEVMNKASHALKVNKIAWSADSKYVASCGTDSAVKVYEVADDHVAVNMRGPHSISVDVTSVQFVGNSRLITTGRQDCSLKIWDLQL